MRTLRKGPDYDGVPMLRRVLERSRGAIAHSHAVEAELRKAGFSGPVGVIPHGAWILDADRFTGRGRLGVEPTAPLIGVFGFLKPYKRIAESLRAFRRLVRLEPRARMILAGEPHPELGLPEMIRSLGLEAHVRVLGFTPIEDFETYLGACDVVLNLRYPTVGESSGTLLRALGMGKAVLVSDVGSFAEYPDDICLKVPVGAGEEDLIFEVPQRAGNPAGDGEGAGRKSAGVGRARMQLGRGRQALCAVPRACRERDVRRLLSRRVQSPHPPLRWWPRPRSPNPSPSRSMNLRSRARCWAGRRLTRANMPKSI